MAWPDEQRRHPLLGQGPAQPWAPNPNAPNILQWLASLTDGAGAPPAGPVPAWPVTPQDPSMLPPGAAPWAPPQGNPFNMGQGRPLPPAAPPMQPRQGAGPSSYAGIPLSGGNGDAFQQMMARNNGRNTPPLTRAFNPSEHVARAPQGGNEPDWVYRARQAYGAPTRMIGDAVDSVVGNVKNFANDLTRTPNNPHGFFMANIVRQESGGRQFDKNGQPLVGRDRAGNIPGANRGGVAIGAAQIQLGTARETAKRHNIPWSEERWKNDQHYNLDLGSRHFGDLAQHFGGDLKKATAAYHQGQGTVDRAVAKHGDNFVQGIGPEGQHYVSTIFGRLGQMAETFGAPPPAFDASPFQYAMGQADQAAALRMKPYSAAFTETPIPDRPQLQEMQAPNFSEGDAAFAATAPKNPFDDPKERRRVQKQQYFKGIGQALAGLSGGEGIGTMLMKIGGMALQGRARGDEMIDAKEDEFEEKMAQYNRALAAREDGQAATTANVLNANIQQRNQRADQIWADNAAKISAKNPTVSNGQLITYDKDPNDPNKFVMTATPLGYGPQAEAAMQKANIGMSMGQAAAEAGRFAYSSGQAAARVGLGLAVQAATAENNPQAAGEGILTQAAMNARAAVQTGSWRSLINPQHHQKLETVALGRTYQSMGIPLREGTTTPQVPLSGAQLEQFRQSYEDSLSNAIYDEVSQAGPEQLQKLITHSVGRNAVLTQRVATQRNTSRTNAKGQTTYGTSWDLDQ